MLFYPYDTSYFSSCLVSLLCITSPPYGNGALYDERVCVCLWVCLSVREHVLVIASVKFTKILCTLPVAVTQFSSDTLCTSGIVDDVTFLVMGRWWRLAAATATPPPASCLLFASCPKPNSHRPPDMTRQCCLCRVRRCELSIETVWQSLNS